MQLELKTDPRDLKKFIATYSGQSDVMLDIKKHYYEHGHLTLRQAKVIEDRFLQEKKRVLH